MKATVPCCRCGKVIELGYAPMKGELFCCSDACYDASNAARDSEQQEEAIDTDERLQAACRRWQERLRLLDWTVQCRFVAQEVLDEECDADIQFCAAHRTAEIRIVQPSERKVDFRNADGPTAEHSLVHELLHLFFVSLDDFFDEKARLLVLEQAINAISAALVG